MGCLLAFCISLAEKASSKDSGTTAFIRQVFNTAGLCVECDIKECKETGVDLQSYAESVVGRREETRVVCEDYGEEGFGSPQESVEHNISDSEDNLITDDYSIQARLQNTAHNYLPRKVKKQEVSKPVNHSIGQRNVQTIFYNSSGCVNVPCLFVFATFILINVLLYILCGIK